MIYAKRLSIPANTDSSSPATITLPVKPGTVERVYIVFPTGCAGLVGVRVVYREHVLWPGNPDEWFYGDGTVYDFPERLELDDLPFEFRLEGYNNDVAYPHKVYFALAIVKEQADLLSEVLAALPVLGSPAAGLEVG